jgi:hypothetical protein
LIDRTKKVCGHLETLRLKQNKPVDQTEPRIKGEEGREQEL